MVTMHKPQQLLLSSQTHVSSCMSKDSTVFKGLCRQCYKSLDNVKQVSPGTEWNRQKFTKCRNFRFGSEVSTRKFRLARLWKSLAKKFPTRLKKAISRRDWYRHQKFKKRRGLLCTEGVLMTSQPCHFFSGKSGSAWG